MTQYLFFYGHNPNKSNTHIFSQWFPCKFSGDNGVEYQSCEQYMMAQKALLFNDMVIYNKIMKSKSPKTAKALGRKVKNFNEDMWKAHREDIVKQGNLYKFSQNPELKKILLATGDKQLVEASPYDRIWGIGFKKSNALKVDQSEWGDNLLGKALVAVRTQLE